MSTATRPVVCEVCWRLLAAHALLELHECCDVMDERDGRDPAARHRRWTAAVGRPPTLRREGDT